MTRSNSAQDQTVRNSGRSLCNNICPAGPSYLASREEQKLPRVNTIPVNRGKLGDLFLLTDSRSWSIGGTTKSLRRSGKLKRRTVVSERGGRRTILRGGKREGKVGIGKGSKGRVVKSNSRKKKSKRGQEKKTFRKNEGWTDLRGKAEVTRGGTNAKGD